MLPNDITMLPRQPLYVSYYTIGNGYAAEAAELVRGLEIHKLPHVVTGVKPGSENEPWSWHRAAQYKAEYLRDIKRAHPDRAIVWLDADARVLQRPRLFDWLQCDVAAHWYRHREFLSGTLYFGPGRGTLQILEDWIDRNREKPLRRGADQPNLHEVLRDRRDLMLVNLPPEYAWIDAGSGHDLSSRAYGTRHPVIIHMQASRRLKYPKN
jgi:hypothetical protein